MQFLVTGCSSGLGLDLARAVLASGHKVIASSRNPAKTPDLIAEIEKAGGAWIKLDVAGPDVESAIANAVAKYGPVDVLINNAGYAAGGVLEDFGIDRAHLQMETNFFGPLRAMQAVIPGMRERKHGVIVNISSAEFWSAHPMASIYSASKFAIEGMSESLQGELAPFGIRVLIAEPGGIRTAFMSPNTLEIPELPAAYKGTMAEWVMNALLSTDGKQGLDPKKTAEAIVQEVLKASVDPPMLRLPLGKESMDAMRAKIEDLTRTADTFETFALAADF